MAAHELHTPLQSLLIGTDSMLTRLRATRRRGAARLADRALAMQQRTLSRIGRAHALAAQRRAAPRGDARRTCTSASIWRALVREVVARHRRRAGVGWLYCWHRGAGARRVGTLGSARGSTPCSTNLLSNAIKYGAGKPITIVVDSDEESGVGSWCATRASASALSIRSASSSASSAAARRRACRASASGCGWRARFARPRRHHQRREPVGAGRGIHDSSSACRMSDDARRLPTGIVGIDTILRGGLDRTAASTSSPVQPGIGKTIFGNQLCFAHARRGGRAVYCTLLAETHGAHARQHRA